MATELVIDLEEPTRAEIAEAITNLCHQAKREFAKVGTPLRPTPWDRRHQGINALLTQWEHAGH